MRGYLPLLIGLAIGFVLYSQWQRNDELDKQIQMLKNEKRGLDTIFVPAKAKIKPIRKGTDSVVALLPPELLPPVRVKLAEERAACDTVIAICELQKANLQKQLDLEKKKHPSRFGCTAGIAATAKGAGLGGSCGIRLF